LIYIAHRRERHKEPVYNVLLEISNLHRRFD